MSALIERNLPIKMSPFHSTMRALVNDSITRLHVVMYTESNIRQLRPSALVKFDPQM